MTTTFRKKFQLEILIGILVIFYSVGIIGLFSRDYRESFLDLSAFNLLLSFIVLVLSRKTQKVKFAFFLLICFITGIAVEWIGTRTGLLFGNYAYGSNLGVKFQGVPLIIGINWGILSVGACTVASSFIPLDSRWKPVLKALFSAFLMVVLDILIEPVAIDSDFWIWQDNEVPVFNYVCWFLISFPLHFVYFKLKLDEQNLVAIALFIIMVLFFAILNFH